jgi:hypothetical protein
MMAIAGIVMFFILFVAGNAMAQSVRERINELGVLKTLGFTDGRILSQAACFRSSTSRRATLFSARFSWSCSALAPG